MHATVESVSDEDRHGLVKTLRFKPEQRLQYSAGQFIELTVSLSDALIATGASPTRQLTLSSAPQDEFAAVTLDFEASSSPFKQELAAVSPGDIIHVSQALGDFVLPLDESSPMVWIAGGIGITPFLSMSRYLRMRPAAASDQPLDISLFHTVSREHYKRLFGQSFTSPFRYLQHDSAVLGRLPAASMINDDAETTYYIAGPPSMVQQLQQDLIILGVKKERIVTDAFLGYV